MTYCDAVYLALFLPLTIIIYSIMPKKHRAKVLLLASYIFFWSISRKLIVYVIASTLSIFGFGKWLEALQNKRNELLKDAEKSKKKEIRAEYLKKQRRVLALGALLNIGVLLVVKYTGFVGGNINTLFKALSIHITLKIPKILMPIGISFYTLQAVSYLFDVYHEKIKAENNLGRLALYMCFFPQVMEGPICRYSETAMQLWDGNQITYQNLKNGIIRIGYGMIKKMIIADRLNEMIKIIFTDYTKYDGGIMVARNGILHITTIYGLLRNNGYGNRKFRNIWSKITRKLQTTIFLKKYFRILDKMAYYFRSIFQRLYILSIISFRAFKKAYN